jgi:hypothetical protein
MKPEKQEKRKKETYTKPVLLVHGSVREITRDLGGAGTDIPQGGSQIGTGPV